MSYSDRFEHIDDDECRRFRSSVELAGRKWTGAILLAGARGAHRFSEYRSMVEGISDRLLASRLQELEREGLIQRQVLASTPVMITYSLTPSGRQLISLLHPLVQWSRARQAGAAE
ncbi:MAG TPA: helix-turn-helix domain-containing protein [Microbacteriaceae bacterium]